VSWFCVAPTKSAGRVGRAGRPPAHATPHRTVPFFLDATSSSRSELSCGRVGEPLRQRPARARSAATLRRLSRADASDASKARNPPAERAHPSGKEIQTDRNGDGKKNSLIRVVAIQQSATGVRPLIAVRRIEAPQVGSTPAVGPDRRWHPKVG